jgi:uncharacterized protein (TIGR02271 family)
MPVNSADGGELGTVEAVRDDGVIVRGQHVAASAVDRVQDGRVYLRGVGAGAFQRHDHASDEQRAGVAGVAAETVEAKGEIRVPEIEERLRVEKRPVDLGEVRIGKTVEVEQQTVPVDLQREDVHVEEVKVDERPAGRADTATAFREGTVRVPVHAEEAVARKEAVVTGEVVVEKERTTEHREVTGTIRKTHVDVDQQPQDTGRTRDVSNVRGRTVPTAEPAGRAAERRGAPATESGAAVRTGFGAVGFDPTTVARGTLVVGADDAEIGRVKEVRGEDFLVDRSGRRDVYVPFDAVAEATDDQIRLTVRADAVDDQGWPNPPLF